MQELDFRHMCSVVPKALTDRRERHGLQGEIGARKLSWCKILNGSRERIQVQLMMRISLMPAGLEMKIKD